MTTDTQLAPTDAEIDALWRFEASKNWDSTLAMRTSFARTVLARWGQPAHSGEPVATIKGWTNGSYWRNYQVEFHSEYLPVGAKLYTAPQPVEREPLPDSWILSRCAQPWAFDTVKQWVRITEAAHGIKGGQQ